VITDRINLLGEPAIPMGSAEETTPLSNRAHEAVVEVTATVPSSSYVVCKDAKEAVLSYRSDVTFLLRLFQLQFLNLEGSYVLTETVRDLKVRLIRKHAKKVNDRQASQRSDSLRDASAPVALPTCAVALHG